MRSQIQPEAGWTFAIASDPPFPVMYFHPSPLGLFPLVSASPQLTHDLSKDAPAKADYRTKATLAHNNYRADPELIKCEHAARGDGQVRRRGAARPRRCEGAP